MNILVKLNAKCFISGPGVHIDRTLNLRLVHLELVRCLEFEGARCQWQQLPSLPQAETVARGPGPHRFGLCKKGLGQGQVGWLRVTWFLLIHLPSTRTMSTETGRAALRWEDQHLCGEALSSGVSCDGGCSLSVLSNVAAHHVWLWSG